MTVLELPEPPGQSGQKGWRSQWWKVRAYKADAWAAAVQQVRPSPDPPRRVRVHLHYRLWNLREQPNLYVDAKPVLDALKQTPSSRDKLAWKNGMFLMRGYFVDDDGVEFGEVTQEVDRSNRGVTVRIEPIE